MLRNLVVAAIMSMAVLIVSQCASVNETVEHPQGIFMTTAPSIGEKYESKGTFIIGEATPGFASSGVAQASYGYGLQGNWSALNIDSLVVTDSWSHSYADVTSGMSRILKDRIVEEVRKRGGNGVIKLKYQYARVPFFFPFVGPIGSEQWVVSGEVIKK